jgi:glutaryl-CoA dehydrogenase
MSAPSIPVTESIADLDFRATDNEFPNGDDLAISRGTDFYGLDELLTDRERELRDRVRVWCDTEVAPAAAGYWERAEFPVELAKGYGRLGIAGASIVGDGCPGLSFLAEGMLAAELARGDGSIATLNAVHSGLAMTTIAMLGSPEQRAQYLPRMATCEILGAFALTEPKHGSDVVALETRARRDGDECESAQARGHDGSWVDAADGPTRDPERRSEPIVAHVGSQPCPNCSTSPARSPSKPGSSPLAAARRASRSRRPSRRSSTS